MFGGGRYLVQNKGLVLHACDNPLPAMAAANATEKAIILAIAMQASPSVAPLSPAGQVLEADVRCALTFPMACTSHNMPCGRLPAQDCGSRQDEHCQCMFLHCMMHVYKGQIKEEHRLEVWCI